MTERPYRARTRSLSRVQRRRRTVIGFVLTVVVLAGVFLVASALSSPEDTSNDDSIRTTQLQETDTVDDARKLLESGDTTAALAVLRARLAVAPSDPDANALLDSIQNPPADVDPDEPNAEDPPVEVPPAPARFLDPVDDLATLLPGDVEGFTVGVVFGDTTDVQVSFDPVVGSDIEASLRTALVSVHDLGDPDDSRAFVDSVSRRGYPVDSEILSLSGVDAYYGTDGGSRSTISFSVGRFAFEVVAASASTEASDARTYVERIANAFPALR